MALLRPIATAMWSSAVLGAVVSPDPNPHPLKELLLENVEVDAPARLQREAPTSPPKWQADGDAMTESVQRLLSEHDQKLGLDLPAAGVVASMLATTVRWHTPNESAATYLAHLGSDRRLSGVTVTKFDKGTQADWERAASDAMDRLRDKTFIVRHRYRGGAHIEIALEQDLQTPARWLQKTERLRKPPPEKPRWPFAPRYDQPGEHPQLTPLETPLPPDLANFGFMFVFDVSEIGANAQRIVYVRDVTVEPVAPVTEPFRD